MKSVIYSNDKVKNTDRRFGSALEYYPARLIRADGSEAGLLFTPDEIAKATERGNNNPEDVPAYSPRFLALYFVAALAALGLVFLWLRG